MFARPRIWLSATVWLWLLANTISNSRRLLLGPSPAPTLRDLRLPRHAGGTSNRPVVLTCAAPPASATRPFFDSSAGMQVHSSRSPPGERPPPGCGRSYSCSRALWEAYTWDAMRLHAGRILAFFITLFLMQPVCRSAEGISVALAKWHPGQRMEVTLNSGEKLVGRLGAVQSDQFVLQPDKRSRAQRTLRFDDVSKVSKKMTVATKWTIAGAIYGGLVLMGSQL